ncbi:ATP-dependent DNA helicase RecQ [Desulfobaculum xiamenense]|uniref:DNA helicase RecQ n=1 Tax=Desulfobaculum xiamenense TaxID=995050 RepID=A0A846QPU9_9BACT|nr:DNA helicase RecQ [Desulfobaculum xiamenense]NJB67244.1 ATP-dependent DNA helicase RecQ [Desulfobaculum xiamenense]
MHATPIDILRGTFGFREFQGLQQPIIDHVCSGGDALVLMPTGGGKSLCYQIPAMVRAGVGIVVSPLIALMQDQVQGLTQMGVRAAYINSSLPAQEAAAAERRMVAGDFDLVYVAPERLLQPHFMQMLQAVDVALFAIDEAHCVSQWGHDFRPEYTQLSVLGERWPSVPRIALTATADGPTQTDIIRQLGFGNARVFSAGFDRPNISYTVVPKDHPRRQLLSFIRERHQGDAGIVYRMSRKKVEETATWLEAQGIPSLPYHAGLSQNERRDNQERFMREEGLVMVATVAFGMGVDKPNVRFVAHLDPPKSLEAYHQETGRAGRDGLPADAWMAYGLADVVLLRRMLDSGGASDERKRVEARKLEAMLGFCETATCRRTALLGYFGEKHPGGCDNCDNCLQPVETWDGTIAAQKALSCIFRTGQRFGAGHLADVLMGHATARVKNMGHDELKTFGCGTELDRQGWQSVYRQLAAAGLLRVDMEGYGSLLLNEASWTVLRGEREVVLRRDPIAAKGRARVRSKAARMDEHDTLATAEARDLFECLRQLRYDISKEQGVPPYAVLPDRSLLEMVRFRPTDTEGMAGLHGVGQAKLRAYATPFLDALRAWEAEHGRPDDLPDAPEAPVRPAAQAKEDLTPTIRETLRLFTENGSVDAVTEARGLSAATVWKHLIACVEHGDIDAAQAAGVDEAGLTRMAQSIREAMTRGIPGLTPVHEAFGGEFSYDQLRCVRAMLLREQDA